jgi:hypothetical protein
MIFFDQEAGFFQALVDFAGDENGAVMAAGAAEGNGEIAFAFADVVRQKVNQ